MRDSVRQVTPGKASRGWRAQKATSSWSSAPLHRKMGTQGAAGPRHQLGRLRADLGKSTRCSRRTKEQVASVHLRDHLAPRRRHQQHRRRRPRERVPRLLHRQRGRLRAGALGPPARAALLRRQDAAGDDAVRGAARPRHVGLRKSLLRAQARALFGAADCAREHQGGLWLHGLEPGLRVAAGDGHGLGAVGGHDHRVRRRRARARRGRRQRERAHHAGRRRAYQWVAGAAAHVLRRDGAGVPIETVPMQNEIKSPGVQLLRRWGRLDASSGIGSPVRPTPSRRIETTRCKGCHTALCKVG